MVDNVIIILMQHITVYVLPVIRVAIVNHRSPQSLLVQAILVCHFVHVSMVVFVHPKVIKVDLFVRVLKDIQERIVNHQVKIKQYFEKYLHSSIVRRFSDKFNRKCTKYVWCLFAQI